MRINNTIYTLPPPLYFHSCKFLHLCGEVFRAICPSADPFREMVRKIAFEVVEVVRLGGYELYSPYKIRRRFRYSLRRIKHFAGLFTSECVEDKSGDFGELLRRLFLSRLIGGGFHRGGVGAAGGSGLIGAAFLPFIMYSAKKCSFSDGCKRQ